MNRNQTPPPSAEHEVLDPKILDYRGWRARFVTTVLRVASLFGLGMLVVSFDTGTTRENILFTILFICLVAITFLRSPYWLRAGSLPALSYIIGVNAILTWGIWREAELFFLFGVVMASLLFDRRVDLAVLGLSALTILVVALLNISGQLTLLNPTAPPIAAATWINFATDYLIITIIAAGALQFFKREFLHVTEQMRVAFNALLVERSRLEERVQDRTQELEQKANQLRSSTSIARTVTQLQDITELMNAVVQLTAEQFGYDQVGIYLLDARKKIAFLQAASSPVGKALIGGGYQVEVEKRNAINLIVQEGKPYFIGNNLVPGPFKEEAFPFTRSRMVLPLQVRGSIIGVIDLQSNQEQSFSQEDAENFQSLADLAAVSIDNVRLLDETRALVSQLESFTAYQSKQSWQAYSGHRASAYQYTPAGVRPLFPALEESRELGDGLKVPLMLRGQSIGMITLRRKDGASGWTERERILIEKVAEQAALALENSRLVEEAQRNAQRDQLIASISSRVRQTLDVEAVIRTAAVELRRIFDLKEAEVSVGTLTSDHSAPSPAASRRSPGRGTKPLN